MSDDTDRTAYIYDRPSTPISQALRAARARRAAGNRHPGAVEANTELRRLAALAEDQLAIARAEVELAIARRDASVAVNADLLASEGTGALADRFRSVSERVYDKAVGDAFAGMVLRQNVDDVKRRNPYRKGGW
ncbi:hypothetical protein E3O55_08410 [Cryobacterium sp. MDB1-18-2]|uniref:hypothetical protein n=1 Tax=unclassified Cryobacterium TaxID=2649013 RepID=UPI00106CCCEB|nr:MULTISPECIES: hypothetical protein [unclassified Cryobacterium]TFC30098.1 hypothetical protein E3O55_08410 [Cryobacterium sp. MDB1-18-2]TFC41378.1 hypothetical protein E3O50_09850 [Cryobacterium sp. MDB1-18-1]